MIRILHYIGSLEYGGSQSFVMNVYRNMDRSKIQFDFVTFPNERGELYDEIIAMGGRVYEAPKYNGKNYLQFVKWWNVFFMEHHEYRILHGHVRSVASIYLPIAKKNGCITIAHSHSTSNGHGILAWIKNGLQYPVRYQADFLFGCSKAAGEWMFGKKMIHTDKYYTIPNAVNVEKYVLNEDIRVKYRTEMGINDKTVFIHVGRFHPSKNHDFLLELFSKIQSMNKKSYLLLVGDGELREHIEKKIKILNLTKNVRLLGTRTDVNKLLMCADVFLFPSRWEGLPLSVVEAQASGLPCLVSDHVTKEVGLTDLVHYLPIDQGYDVWLNKIKTMNLFRKNVRDDIVKAGFDIKATAEWLQNFYLEI